MHCVGSFSMCELPTGESTSLHQGRVGLTQGFWQLREKDSSSLPFTDGAVDWDLKRVLFGVCVKRQNNIQMLGISRGKV